MSPRKDFWLGWLLGTLATFAILASYDFWQFRIMEKAQDTTLKSSIARARDAEIKAAICETQVSGMKHLEIIQKAADDSNLYSALSSAVVIAEPEPQANQAGEFLGTLFGAFLGHPAAAKALLSQMNSTGMQARFFINSANHQVVSYNPTQNPASFYYWNTSAREWAGPYQIPPIQTLKANPAQ